jgi:hypothetical protein
MSVLLLLVALWSRTSLADSLPPSSVVGTWTGTTQQSFALANVAVPGKQGAARQHARRQRTRAALSAAPRRSLHVSPAWLRPRAPLPSLLLAGSWECLQGGAVSSRPQTVVIDAAGSVMTSALTSQTFDINGGAYVVPAQPAGAWTWAYFNESSSILQLRPVAAPASPQCFYFAATATTLTLVDVGGQAVTDDWNLQCAG